jgi:hypothetical protein
MDAGVSVQTLLEHTPHITERDAGGGRGGPDNETSL